VIAAADEAEQGMDAEPEAPPGRQILVLSGLESLVDVAAAPHGQNSGVEE
jgi:hypothetical protein